MKKTACVFLYGISTALLCGLIAPFLLCSCNASDEMKADSDPVTITTTDSTLPNQFLDSDKLAFTAYCSNGGPFDWGNDYWEELSYSVYYNGSIEIKTNYTLSGESVVTKEISYIDFKRIMTLADTFRDKRDSYDLDFSNCYDMDSWSFYTYDTEGSRTPVYSGFIEGITELVGISNTLYRYADKETPSDRAFDLFEGRYVCPDDNQQYVLIYKKGDQVYLEVKPAGQPDAEVYEIREIVLADEGVSFEYVEGNLWHSISYSYSVGKTQLQDKDTSVIYKKQMGDSAADKEV